MHLCRTPASHYHDYLDQNYHVVLAVLKRLARRHRLTRDETDELHSRLHLRLVQDDYAALRQFEGRSGFATYLTTVAAWMTNITTQYGGNPYQHLVEMGRLAQRKGVIRGILLHQGESNVNDKAWPTKVAKIYADLLKDLNLGAATVPLLAGETVNADQQGASSAINTIMAALPTSIPTAHVISSAGCEARRDRLHFTPAGYRELGKRYAEKMLTLL